MNEVQLEHNGVVKEVPRGWSWTTLLFGPFPALLRGDIKWAAIILISQILLAIITLGVGCVIMCFVWAAIYNDRYYADLRSAGWQEV